MSRVVQTVIVVGLFTTLGTSLMPTSAAATVNAKVLCAVSEIQQCPAKTYNYKYCGQWGLQYGSGGPVKCCKKWVCGEIH
jgi:hypothetical protein